MLIHIGAGSEGLWTRFCTASEKHTGLGFTGTKAVMKPMYKLEELFS